MQSAKTVEIGVGLFMLAAIAALLFISLRVAISYPFKRESTYPLYATFDDISGLKPRSPILIGGVVIGEINRITLNNDYRPSLELAISQRYNQLPRECRLVIRTAGLLGEKYLAIVLPGLIDEEKVHYLKAGETIEDTSSSIILEDLIGRFLYSPKQP